MAQTQITSSPPAGGRADATLRSPEGSGRTTEGLPVFVWGLDSMAEWPRRVRPYAGCAALRLFSG
jgi:hypothetical protein